MFYGKIDAGKYLFKQNDQATSFFVVDRGKLKVEIDGKFIRTLVRGNSFGELALLYNAPRSGSIKAIVDTYVWGIEGHIFKKLLKDLNNKQKKENLYFINQIPLFKELTEFQKEILASNLIT